MRNNSNTSELSAELLKHSSGESSATCLSNISDIKTASSLEVILWKLYVCLQLSFAFYGLEEKKVH